MAKKIIATISLVLIGLLIVATIVMANVKVDYSVRCNAPDDIIVVTPSGSMPDPSTEQEQEIVKLISNASKRSSLSALFDGSLFDNARIIIRDYGLKFLHQTKRKLQFISCHGLTQTALIKIQRVITTLKFIKFQPI